MNSIIELLDRRCESLCKQRNNWHFFLELADYIKYVNETPEFQKVILGFQEKKDKDCEKLNRLEEKSLKELNISKKKIIKIIKDNKISNKSLDQKLRQIRDFENAKVRDYRLSGHLYLHTILDDIAINLSINEYKDLLKEFFDSNEKDPRFRFSKFLEVFKEEKEKIEDKAKKELWGAWDELYSFFLFIYKQEEAYKKFGDKIMFEFSLYETDMKKLEEASNAIIGSVDPMTFVLKRTIYEGYISRIHIHLITELRKEEDKSKQQESNNDKEGKKSKVLAKFSTPPGTKWRGDVHMELTSKDCVRITVGSVSKELHFAEIGMKDNRRGEFPDSRWELFQTLAMQNGELLLYPDTIKSKKLESIQKKVQALRKILKQLMGIDDDPFNPYDSKENAYVTKFDIKDVSHLEEHQESLRKIKENQEDIPNGTPYSEEYQGSSATKIEDEENSDEYYS